MIQACIFSGLCHKIPALSVHIDIPFFSANVYAPGTAFRIPDIVPPGLICQGVVRSFGKPGASIIGKKYQELTVAMVAASGYGIVSVYRT